MAAMILAMLAIGMAMVARLGVYHALLAWHRPLGVGILVLAVIRTLNRHFSQLPPFPETMSAAERKMATWSERLMYGLFFAQPLVGWGMLSAGGYPVEMWGAVHLPRILPASPWLYSVLRPLHTVLAYAFMVVVLGHIGAVLYHALVLRDGLLRRMTISAKRARGAEKK
ncbi:MAG: cytochrome b [Tepidisphaera sp.]|nr:cytochrome b [Tepidisphaera sp.]